jgi:hypothetical protein
LVLANCIQASVQETSSSLSVNALLFGGSIVSQETIKRKNKTDKKANNNFIQNP